MRRGTLALLMVAGIATACGADGGESTQLIHEQRLSSGKTVKVVSCVLAWGAEHDQRFPNRDGFALEYIANVPRDPAPALDAEALEVFELIRPLSEQWGLQTATVSALRSPDRTGTWDVFAFTRSSSGTWSHTSQTIKR